MDRVKFLFFCSFSFLRCQINDFKHTGSYNRVFFPRKSIISTYLQLAYFWVTSCQKSAKLLFAHVYSVGLTFLIAAIGQFLAHLCFMCLHLAPYKPPAHLSTDHFQVLCSINSSTCELVSGGLVWRIWLFFFFFSTLIRFSLCLVRFNAAPSPTPAGPTERIESFMDK